MSAAAIGAYAIGWQPAVGQSPRTPVAGHVGALSAYTLTLLGGPVAAGDAVRAWRWGTAAIAILVTSVGFVWWRAPARRTAVLPWAVLGAYAAGAAALTATGRLSAGAHTALLSRYATFATPLWVAVGPAAALAIASVPALRLRQALGVAALATASLAAWHGVQTSRLGDARMADRATMARRAAACVLADPAHAPDACFRMVCWDAGWARGNAAGAPGARPGAVGAAHAVASGRRTGASGPYGASAGSGGAQQPVGAASFRAAPSCCRNARSCTSAAVSTSASAISA